MLKKTKGKTYIRIYINVQEFNIWKIYKLKVYMHPTVLKNYGECKMQLMSNGFNTFKMSDSIHVQMLIVQEMRKNSLTHSNINVRH
jgi:hypothetical protein